VFYDMTYDADVGGHFTIPVVRRDVKLRMNEIEAKFGIKTVAVVADNASNMQGIAVKHDETPTEEELPEQFGAIPFLVRCACHALQLVVQKLRPHWNAAFEAADTAVKAANVKVSANETRWSSSFNVIIAALDRAPDDLSAADATECKSAVELLGPFWQMTDYLQGATRHSWTRARHSKVCGHSSRNRQPNKAHLRSGARSSLRSSRPPKRSRIEWT